MCSIIKCACNENIFNTTLRLETNTMKHDSNIYSDIIWKFSEDTLT